MTLTLPSQIPAVDRHQGDQDGAGGQAARTHQAKVRTAALAATTERRAGTAVKGAQQPGMEVAGEAGTRAARGRRREGEHVRAEGSPLRMVAAA